jgi:hypothetical protein
MAGSTIPFAASHGVVGSEACEAIQRAAMIAIDEAFMDVADWARAPYGPATLVSPSYLPENLRAQYDLDLAKQWTMVLTVVAFKLCQGNHLPLSCLAERWALHALIEVANAAAEERGEPPPQLDRLRESLGDTDFSPSAKVAMSEFFECFNEWSMGPVHPFLLH